MTKQLASFRSLKQEQKPICMLTCYSAPTGAQVDEAGVDIALVGDSLGTTILGYESTTSVTMADMIHHVKAVCRGCHNAYVIADMPYQSYEDKVSALKNAQALIEAGANGVKLEGTELEIVQHLRAHDIDVCGHLGYLPQTALRPGVVGKEASTAQTLLKDALALEQAGIDMLVLELVPKQLSAYISQQLHIPTIGIGAGAACDGQVQVLDDLLGMGQRVFKHAKVYAQHREHALSGIKQYCEDVRAGVFPTDENTSHVSDGFISDTFGG